MFAKLKAIFADTPEKDEVSDEQRTRLACAALMTEVATIDNRYDEAEAKALIAVLTNEFQLSEDEAIELQQLAEKERNDATSLHQFTSLINEHCEQDEKYRLVQSMWRVAFADGQLDKYEEYIIRRASELIYLDHSDFIRAKISVKNATER